jgi:hypothetical protein
LTLSIQKTLDIESGLSFWKRIAKNAWENVQKEWDDSFNIWTRVEELVSKCKLPSLGPPGNFHLIFV